MSSSGPYNKYTNAGLIFKEKSLPEQCPEDLYDLFIFRISADQKKLAHLGIFLDGHGVEVNTGGYRRA